MPDYLAGLQDTGVPVRAGDEPGALGKVRSQLVAFLDTSLHYVPERLLAHFPMDGM